MNYKNYISKTLIIISFIYLTILTYIGLSTPGIWSDEIFSYAMAIIPFNEFLEIGIHDVHPLLYYIILRIFFGLALFFNFENLVLISKFVSIIPIYLLLIISYTKIKNEFGLFTAAIFSLCILSMPQLMIYSVEVRMYTWSLFFNTASFIIIYELIKRPTIKNWIILTILTICSCYTHYFSAITSIVLYLMFLIYIIINKKELIKRWVISTIICCLSFIPWIPYLILQLTNVNSDFWIDPISLNSIITYIYYILSPATTFAYSNITLQPTIIGTLMLITIFALIVYSLKHKEEKEIIYSYYGLIIVILVPIIGIILSLIMTPIMHPRYLVPLLGIFWLSISILISKIYINKNILTAIILLLIIIGSIGTLNFIEIENQQAMDDKNISKSFTDIIITNNTTIFYDEVIPYLKLSNYYLNGNVENIYFKENIGQNIKNTLENSTNLGNNIYYVDAYDSNYEECINNNIKLDKKGTVIKYDIYEVFPK